MCAASPARKHASLAESVAAPRVESIHRLALDLQLLRVDPWRDQPGDAFRAFQLFPRFAGLQHELPTLPAAGCGHVRCRAPRITDKLDVINR